MKNFNNFIDDTNLRDPNLLNASFTWSNFRENAVCRKLDRFLFSEAWEDSFPHVKHTALARVTFDHCPIRLDTSNLKWGPGPFRFENMWIDYPYFKKKFKLWWGEDQINGWEGYKFSRRLRTIKQKIKDWNKEVFGDLVSAKKEAEARIAALDLMEGQGGLDNILRKEREDLYFKVSDLVHKEEVKWRQRGKIQWARDGDSNTKFFHRIASGRRKRNFIQKLEVAGDGVVVSEGEIELEIINFFKNLYSSNAEAGWCLEGLNWNAISVEEAEWLERPFEEEEVKRAVFDCGIDKSPGPDGFSMLLFQSCWDIVKEDLMKVMVDFFNCGIINAITNETFICLIPKKKESIKVSDFRPISLVTSLYKMVSKVLASRLREVLGSTISSYQSAFVQGRQILDAALIANEVVEESRRLNKSGMVFKIDLEKAYDHVEWRFVDEVLIRKGFGDRWRSWIRGSLETANFSVMINGRPRGKFRASRGLRQGDPLSPFLFTLVMDVLSRIMEKAQDADMFHGLSPGLGMVEVSHLQFADDTIFFIEDKDEYWNNLLQILELFCFVSGMEINKSKCSLVGINLDDGLLNELAGAWGCEVGAWPMSYLGLPLGGNPRAIKFWDPVVEKVENRLQKWKRACLSKEGRLTMIQAVLCSIPIYYMSLFRIPIGVANRIEKLMRDFLWEGLDGKRNHAVSWEVVGKAKFYGGLGVGSLRARSAALRAKWLWRFPNEPHALWHKVIRSIYGMDTNGWDAKPATRGSCRSLWRDISSGYNLFLQGCVFEVGCGVRVRFWEDDWSGVVLEVFPRLFNLSRKQNHNISSFTGLDGFPLSWDFSFRRNLNELEITEAARLLDLLEGVRVITSRLDKRRWKLDPFGLFTCHSFCSHIQNRDEREIFSPYTQIWKAKTPPKVKIFVWQAVLGKLNTGDTLQRRCPYLCISPHWCALCNKAGQSVDHLLIHCPFSLKLWETLLKEVNTVWVIPEGCFELFSIRFDALGRGKKAKILWGSLMQAVVWNLWMERSRRIFEDYKGVGVAELWDRVKFWAALWASTSPAFKDVPYPIIMRNLLAVVS
ncbi:uncharacterized protein LOC18774736 [Prunus persica]|uniref:uncharacterized protein LOC18774736 n=1 Tax=Prunus persica TaxID=3760 RepID=UPI0009AB7FC8|nr:uncharacterized protein LOC18774736 [Prunus persica]